MNNSIMLSHVVVMAVFLSLYLFIYRRQPLFTINRVYLLSSLCLSLIIPFLHFELIPIERVYELNHLKISRTSTSPVLSTDTTIVGKNNIILWLYLGGCLISLSYFLISLSRHLILIRKTTFTKENECHYGQSSNGMTFSFFNYIFLSDDDDVKRKHEEAHAKLGHSWDRIFMALIICINWFNPMVYLYRYFLIENHEFTADAYAMKKCNMKKSDYGALLLQSSKHQYTSLTLENQFNSLIKNRMMILLQSSNYSRLWYVMMLPLFILTFSGFTVKTYTVYTSNNIQSNYLDTIPGEYYVIDTIVSFNAATQKEQLEIVKNVGYAEQSFRNTELSGEIMSWRDTIITFNPETNEENIEVLNIELPKEYLRIYNLLSPSQKEIALSNYGKVEVVSSGDKSNTILFIDTIAVFNPETKKESISVVKSEVDFDQYLNNLQFSGERVELVDTVLIYNYDTYSESQTIEVYTYPIEIYNIKQLLNAKQQRMVAGKFKVIKSLTYQGSKSGTLFIGEENEIRVFELFDKNNKVLSSIEIPKGKSVLDLTLMNLTSGNFKLRQKGSKDFTITLYID